MQITIPFSKQPDSGSQVFDMDTCLRSQFQINTLLEVSQREDFSHFVVVCDRDGDYIMAPEFKGPCNVLWYNTSGDMMYSRVGVTKLLTNGWLCHKR